MQLHLHVLEELVHGLGARSTRHVMTRAGLLALEVTVHLPRAIADCTRNACIPRFNSRFPVSSDEKRKPRPERTPGGV